MDYTLAKRLKDAGFPQEIGHDCCFQGCCSISSDKENVCLPVLAYLIEMCWQFSHQFRLDYNREKKSWVACTSWGDGEDNWQEGTTAEIAIAYLYLALKGLKK